MKRVVVKHTFDVVHEVPDDWSKEQIEFFFNDSSSCSNNVVEDMLKREDGYCMCDIHSAAYLREATKVDAEGWIFENIV